MGIDTTLSAFVDGAESNAERNASSDKAPSLQDDEHEQNDNWEWSPEFTQFISDAIEGRSLKICPGLHPICDVNLDIEHLGTVAQSDNADFSVTEISPADTRIETLRETLRPSVDEDVIYGRVVHSDNDQDSRYDGYACKGDMFDLPFADNSFDTVVSDPPWKSLSRQDRRRLFDEAVRVLKPTGLLLYNATWVPDHEYAKRYDIRFRQQLDFWGGPSFATFYRRASRNLSELFEAHQYDSVERHPDDSPFWTEEFPPDTVSLAENTNPKIVSGHTDHAQYCCPMCGCSQLRQIQHEFLRDDGGQFSTYECCNCQFRAEQDEIDRLASELEKAATRRNKPIHELQDIDYTPPCVEAQLERVQTQPESTAAPLTPSLPWVPSEKYSQSDP